MFAASANAQVDRCNSGHSAMLSQTALLADKIAAVAKERNARGCKQRNLIKEK